MSSLNLQLYCLIKNQLHGAFRAPYEVIIPSDEKG